MARVAMMAGRRRLLRTMLRRMKPWLATFALMALLAHSTLPPAALAQSPSDNTDDNCPLSDEQAQKSVDAFDKIAQVLTGQPRCFNCHGGISVFGPEAEAQHGGGRRELTTRTLESDHGPVTDVDEAATLLQCHQCHSAFPGTWQPAPGRDYFVGKDAFTLCTQMRDNFGAAESFIEHIEHDFDPSNPFVQEGFTGRMGLNGLGKDLAKKYPDPPVGVTHQDLIQMAHDWVDAQGGKFQGDDTCGCKPIPSWYGTIKGQAQWNVYNDNLSMNFNFTLGANGVVKGKGHAKMTNAPANNAGCLWTIKRTPDEMDIAISGRRDGDWFDLQIEIPRVASTVTSRCRVGGHSSTPQMTFFGIMSTGPSFKAPRVLAKDGATNSLDFQMPGRVITGTIEIHEKKKNSK